MADNHGINRKWAIGLGLAALTLVALWVFGPALGIPSPYRTLDLPEEQTTSLSTVLERAYMLRNNYARVLLFTDISNALVRVLELAGLGLGAIVLLMSSTLRSEPRSSPDRTNGQPPSTPPRSGNGNRFPYNIQPRWVLIALAVIALSHVMSEAYGSERRREILGRASFVVNCAISTTTSPYQQGYSRGRERRARDLWKALNAVQGSVIAELSSAQLGGSRSVEADDSSSPVDSCLTRLLTP